MKLYAFQPTSYGPPSFFVLAESEDEAKDSVERYIAEMTKKAETEEFDFDPEGWGTDGYKVTVFERGQVAYNDNL
jgi:hypothetical protein